MKFLKILEGFAPWRENKNSHEHVQGILVDIRFLMDNYKSSSKSNIEKLAIAIESAYKRNIEKFSEHEDTLS